MKYYLKRLIEKVGDIATDNLQSQINQPLYDINALELLPDLKVGYIPWSSFTIRPSALVFILNELTMNQSKTVIECGIGMSTLYMLGDHMNNSIKVIGIDDDANWIELIESYLIRMGVPAERYCLIHAPIKDYDKNTIGRKWYDIDKIDPAISDYLGNKKADLLLVDGPKGSLCEKSRYQALPGLFKYLNDDYAVFLDDIHRKNEYEIGRLWSKEFGINIKYHKEQGGIAILRPENTNKCRIIT